MAKNQTDQKSIFLKEEGNQWFKRNHPTLQAVEDKLQSDWILNYLSSGNLQPSQVLEIGCSNGWRLEMIRKKFNSKVTGLEPSLEAITNGRTNFGEITFCQGTADNLPFAKESFDLIIIGFCLYLCDREDLFKIVAEVDRVLVNQGNLILLDFYSPTPFKNPYSHLSGVSSYKMDYAQLFLSNPVYNLIHQSISSHQSLSYVADPNEKISLSVLNKCFDFAYPDNPFSK